LKFKRFQSADFLHCCSQNTGRTLMPNYLVILWLLKSRLGST